MIHDVELAKRLEDAHREGGELAALAAAKLDPTLGACYEAVTGGSMIFCGADGSFLSHVLGLGVGCEVSDDDLDRIEEFYRSRNSPAELDLSPFADPTLGGRLFDRGFRHDHFENVLIREMKDCKVGEELPDGLKIVVPPEDFEEEYGKLLVTAFEIPEDMQEMGQFVGQIAFMTHGAISLLGMWNEKPVACATINYHNGVAAFAGAATLPEYRGRGIQLAFLNYRLQMAKEQGCDLAMSVTEVASTSQRNAERCGFRPVYTRTVLVKEFDLTTCSSES